MTDFAKCSAIKILLAAALVLVVPVLKTSWGKQGKHTQPATQPAAHSIDIYLVTDPKACSRAEEMELSAFTLSTEPLISRKDIRWYDWRTHTIYLVPAVSGRIRKLKGLAEPFVLVVDGKRLYLGAFCSCISSYLPKVPIINVGPTSSTLQPKGTIRIYPSPRASQIDPRNDTMLRNVLRNLKLLDEPTTAPGELSEKDATVEISLAPREETVKSLKHFSVVANARNLNQDAAKTGQWEIRTAGNKKRVARIAYNWRIPPDQFLPDGKRITGGTRRTARYTLNQSQLRRVGALEQGTYLLAWYVAGKRCSNVMQFRIDKDYDAKSEPLLKLAQIAPGPAQEFPLLVLRAYRHTEDDPNPLASDIAHATLNINGQDRNLTIFMWIGPDMPLKVGSHYTYILDLARYTRNPDGLAGDIRPIDPKKKNVMFAKVGKHQSNSITLTFDRSLSEKWDRATERLAQVPAPLERPVVLSGIVTSTVISADGKPAVGYEVHLFCNNGGNQFSEKTDEGGLYTFRSIPAGCYKVVTNLPGRGQPQLVVQEVTVGKKVITLNLSLEKKFSFSGLVTYPDGTPAPNRTVMATWPLPDGKARYDDFATTDAEGRYTLGAPYKVASFVGWGGKQVKHRVKAGRNDVDFVAPKPKDRSSAAQPPYEGTEGFKALLNLRDSPDPKAVKAAKIVVRRERLLWKKGVTPAVRVDIGNSEMKRFFITRTPDGYEVEINSRWYRWAPARGKAPKYISLVKGAHCGGVRLVLDKSWQSKADGTLLHLGTGKYKLRIGVICRRTPDADAEYHTVVSKASHVIIESPAVDDPNDPGGFRREMLLVKEASVLIEKIRHIRKALQYRPQPDDIKLEYEVAAHLNGVAGQRSREEQEATCGEVRDLYQHIIDTYDHMDYYTANGPDGSRKPEMLLPRSAMMLGYRCGNPKSQQVFYQAMAWLKQTNKRRIQDWKNEPPPSPPDENSPVRVHRAKERWQTSMNGWRKRREAAKAGTGLKAAERKLALLVVRGYVKRSEPGEVTAALSRIAQAFSGTHMGRLARKQLALATGIPKDRSAQFAWGKSILLLRCRWVAPNKPVPIATAPMVSVQVENAGNEPVVWQCTTQNILRLRLAELWREGSWVSPKFRTRIGRNARLATAGEVRQTFGRSRAGGDANRPVAGYYRLEPGGQLTLTAKLPWSIKSFGTYRVQCELIRSFNVSIEEIYTKGRMTCPPLFLDIVPVAQPMVLPAEQAAFWAGDYRRMGELYKRLSSSPQAKLEDILWYGHSHQLVGNWQNAVDIYKIALASLQPKADSIVEYPNMGRSREICRLQRSGGPLREQWAKLLLLIGRIELLQLKDPAKASETLLQGLRYAPLAARPIEMLSADAAAAIEGIEKQYSARPGQDSNLRSALMYPLAIQRHLAMAYEKRGMISKAVECLTRIQLCRRGYGASTGMVKPDPLHIARLWAKLPTDKRLPPMPIFSVLSERQSQVKINPSKGKCRLASWWDNSWNNFALVPQPGKAFASLEISCVMNHRKQKYRESLRCWIGHTSSYNPQGRLLMSHHWPKNVPVGRKSYTFKFDVPYDADVVFIRTPGNVNYNPVSEMTVRATFRPGGIGKTIPPAKPVLSAEILRKRGTLTADNPFRPIQLNLPKFSQLGPSGGNIVAMPDGKLLMAYTSGYAEQRKILLTASKDGKTWAKPWGMAHNSIFNTASPSMIVDDDGVIWMLYISKRFRYDFSSAGYYLWITKSLDGQAWSIPKPVKIQGVGKHQAKYQYVAQLTRRPDGKYCIFYNSHFGSGNSPGDIRELRLMALPITDSMYPNNTHATFDTNGRCYLVFDDFGRAIYYTHSDNMKTWLPLVKLAKKRKNSSIRFPQLFIDAKRVALVYGEHAGDWLRRGTITPNLLGLGRPIRITDGLVPVNGSRLMRNGDDMYLPAGGDYVPVLLHGRYRDIMGR